MLVLFLMFFSRCVSEYVFGAKKGHGTSNRSDVGSPGGVLLTCRFNHCPIRLSACVRISYCKSHMQKTKRAPRLHETYGFEVRSHQLTLQKRCIVEQLTFEHANLLIIKLVGADEIEVRYSEL